MPADSSSVDGPGTQEQQFHCPASSATLPSFHLGFGCSCLASSRTHTCVHPDVRSPSFSHLINRDDYIPYREFAALRSQGGRNINAFFFLVIFEVILFLRFFFFWSDTSIFHVFCQYCQAMHVGHQSWLIDQAEPGSKK